MSGHLYLARGIGIPGEVAALTPFRWGIVSRRPPSFQRLQDPHQTQTRGINGIAPHVHTRPFIFVDASPTSTRLAHPVKLAPDNTQFNIVALLIASLFVDKARGFVIVFHSKA